MPAETHQLGQAVGADDVVELICGLLGDQDQTGVAGATATLAELGVSAESLGDLWDAVCEEFAERALGPEVDPDFLDPSMSVHDAAIAMTVVLRAGSFDAR